jgi:hypothetical protein
MAMYDVARAGEVLAAYRDWAPGEPDDSSTAVVVTTVPPLPQVPEAVRGRRVLALRGLYLGGAAEAERLWAPLRAAAGEPLLDSMESMTYAEASAKLGAPPTPTVADLHIDLFRELPDAALDVVADPEGPTTAIELRHWGGAMASAGPDGGPCGHRDVPFSVVATAMAEDRDGLAAAQAATGEVTARLRPHATGGSFLNFLGDPARTATAYTEADYARLADVKAVYDPGNVFRTGHNIPPASAM